MPTEPRWTVGALEEYANGCIAVVVSAHGARAVLYDPAFGLETAFMPAEADAADVATDEDDRPWCIITPDEEGLPDYAAALAVVLEGAA